MDKFIYISQINLEESLSAVYLSYFNKSYICNAAILLRFPGHQISWVND